jgi:hypothetical protein
MAMKDIYSRHALIPISLVVFMMGCNNHRDSASTNAETPAEIQKEASTETYDLEQEYSAVPIKVALFFANIEASGTEQLKEQTEQMFASTNDINHRSGVGVHYEIQSSERLNNITARTDKKELMSKMRQAVQSLDADVIDVAVLITTGQIDLLLGYAGHEDEKEIKNLRDLNTFSDQIAITHVPVDFINTSLTSNSANLNAMAYRMGDLWRFIATKRTKLTSIKIGFHAHHGKDDDSNTCRSATSPSFGNIFNSFAYLYSDIKNMCQGQPLAFNNQKSQVAWMNQVAQALSIEPKTFQATPTIHAKTDLIVLEHYIYQHISLGSSHGHIGEYLAFLPIFIHNELYPNEFILGGKDPMHLIKGRAIDTTIAKKLPTNLHFHTQKQIGLIVHFMMQETRATLQGMQASVELIAMFVDITNALKANSTTFNFQTNKVRELFEPLTKHADDDYFSGNAEEKRAQFNELKALLPH